MKKGKKGSKDVQLKDEHDVIDYEVGTNGFEAPEMFARDGEVEPYSPILADRWSCGVSIRDFLGFDKGGNACRRKELRKFANRLMDEVPKQRPSLLEWSGFKKEELESVAPLTVPQKRPFVVDEDDSKSNYSSAGSECGVNVTDTEPRGASASHLPIIFLHTSLNFQR